MGDTNILKYIPYQTLINPSFWYKLTQIKLDIDKLNENRRQIWGWYTNVRQQHNLPFLEIDCTSFNLDFPEQNNFLPVHGFILNKNTIEQFKECNKLELLDNEGINIVQNFKNGKVLEDPSLLNTFLILSFADLKKYHYYFWFAFPTPVFNVYVNKKQSNITECFNDDQMVNLMRAFNNISNISQKSFFIVKTELNNKIDILTLSSIINQYSPDTNLSCCDELLFGFSDPSTDEYPGWPMRNFMALLLFYCPNLQNKNINVLSMRIDVKQKQYTCSNSIIFNVHFPQVKDNSMENYLFGKSEQDQSKWTGWQKNERGKFGPKLVDMSSDMDPIKLAENSVDLNLKLMKWRLLPDIDLDKLKETKFLLLGSGTLGCSVARNLLAWGVHHISLVDNGKVSYSNPVRQSLFNHEDCFNGGRPKAMAAADNLKKIFPCVNSAGYMFSIPMPGHTVGPSLLEETKRNVDLLTQLISTHDVIFLLMDSRESRWLPTVLAAHFNKCVINAALGFDTYLVMRHGSNSQITAEDSKQNENSSLKSIPGNELGCYFCNDITAPGNSLKDRTLDQQCTVTRPGVSPIAGALAVELAISILQHKNGTLAPAFYKTISSDITDNDDVPGGLLGLLPHSIRGFLASFSHVLPATHRFQQCIACSPRVLQEYKQDGFDFLLNVFNSSKYLEDLTGLTELHQETDAAEIWDICSSDDSD